MLLKIRRLGIGGHFYSTIKSMYSQTISSVKLRSGLTDKFEQTAGIKQGDGLSPMLFNIFIDDVSAQFNSPDCDPLDLQGTTVGSLLYADDIVLLSTSAAGLRESLRRAEAFCLDWKLRINTNKTNIIIFRRSRSPNNKTSFQIYGKDIEVVESITYLGIRFSSAGDFKLALTDLKTKAMRAMFKIDSCLKDKCFLNAHTELKLFDALVKPILLYGCQVLCQNFVLNLTKENIFDKIDLMPFEQIHNKACKRILGVNKYSSNLAARAELGRFPLFMQVIKHSANYWQNILQSPSKLSYKAYQEEKISDSKGIRTWATFMRLTLEKTNHRTDWARETINKTIPQKLMRGLKDNYVAFFQTQLKSPVGTSGKGGNKLRTYALVKQGYTLEPYLQSFLPPHIARTIAKFRIGAHDLEIERGRKTNTPADQRYCLHCKHVVEDEIHFLLNCPQYDSLRNDLFTSCNFEVDRMSDQSKYQLIMGDVDPSALFNVGTFLCGAFQLRKRTYDVH
jgi:hypothetical protein